MTGSRLGALRDSSSWSAAPADAAEARQLWQRRLVLYTAATTLLSGGHLIASALVHGLILDEARYQDSWGPRIELLTVLLGGAFWAVSRWRAWSTGALYALDLAFAFLIGTGYTLIGYGFAMPGGSLSAQFLLPIALTLILRAAVIPVDPRRTTVINLAAIAPTLVIVGVMVRRATPAESLLGALSFADVATWSATITAASAVVSYVTFRLRERVREVAQLGQYTLAEQIGAGGMGRVYRAHHALLRRPTAVKLMPPGIASPEDLRRFEREVQLTASLTHPNTVAIYDYGHSRGGVFYYAMEYIEGLTLTQVVAIDGPQPPARVIHVLRQACGALSEAHTAGLVHRDIKPDNLLLCERGGIPDMVKIVDFGLAKDLAEVTHTSRPDAIAGTPLYLSPEAIRSPGDVGPRSDLYALGAVAYYLLTGRHVFDGGSVIEICSHHLNTPPTPPSEALGRPLPADLEELVMRCLDKDAARRPASAADLDGALAACERLLPWNAQEARDWWQHHRAHPPTAQEPSTTSHVTTVLSLDLAREASTVPASRRQGGD